MTKPTKWHVRQAKRGQPGHPPSLIIVFVYTQWIAKDQRFLQADSEGSDSDLADAQADLRLLLLVLSCSGSILKLLEKSYS